MYLKFYLCLHVVALITIFVLPKFVRGERRSQNTKQTTSNQNSLDVDEKKQDATTACNFSNKNKLTGNDDEQEDKNIAVCRSNATAKIIADEQLEEKHNVASKKPAVAPALATVNSGREAVAVPHDQCEMDQLSSKLLEKIEAETKNIEDFIDKTVTDTVTGIVEFKNDLMREIPNGLRKRTSVTVGGSINDVLTNGKPAGENNDESAAFLKKEIEAINAVVQQANILPAVLSNGHAK